MVRVIKRYDNRKLYDTEGKQYISLSEIADLIRAGNDVVVIDNSSGADITPQTLSKIITDQGASPLSLSVEYLHQLLRKGALSASSGWEQLQKGIHRRVHSALGEQAPLREMREEISRLKARIKDLEESLTDYELEVSDGRNDDERDGSKRGPSSRGGTE